MLKEIFANELEDRFYIFLGMAVGHSQDRHVPLHQRQKISEQRSDTDKVLDAQRLAVSYFCFQLLHKVVNEV